MTEQSRKLGEFDREFIIRCAHDQYDRGHAGFDIQVGQTALLVIDMVDEFVKPEFSPYWVPEATEQVPKIKQVIDACRTHDVPVIYTGYAFHEKGIDIPRGAQYIPIYQADIELLGKIFKKVGVYGPIAPEPGDVVIAKPTYDAFHGTELNVILRNLGIETVIVCGTMTNYCCGTTARSAFMHGYNVVFGSDINSSDIDELHQAEVRTLRRGFAKILSADEITAALHESGRAKASA